MDETHGRIEMAKILQLVELRQSSGMLRTTPDQDNDVVRANTGQQRGD